MAFRSLWLMKSVIACIGRVCGYVCRDTTRFISFFSYRR